MTIAKGQSNCKAERALVLLGFDELLQILAESQIEQENLLKAKLYDIVTDNSLSDDEKYTLKRSLTDQLQDIEERHARIRRSIFIGIYSFWEVSLMNIVNTSFSMEELEKILSKKQQNIGVQDYLKMIYGEKLPTIVYDISKHFRELRNYLVHGTLDDKRKLSMDYLISAYHEIDIKNSGNNFYFGNYNGLKSILLLFSRELDNAENKFIVSQQTRK